MTDEIIFLCKKCFNPLDGSHKTYCKACFAEYARNRRAKDPEKYNAYAREWYAKNSDIVADRLRQRYAADPVKWSEYYRNWRKENPESRKITRRKGHLRECYGISIQDFEAMMYAQSNLCLICNKEMVVGGEDRAAYANVDHDHETGDIRGLLCHSCNNGLGCFKDNPELLVAAAAYILRYRMSNETAQNPKEG